MLAIIIVAVLNLFLSNGILLFFLFKMTDLLTFTREKESEAFSKIAKSKTEYYFLTMLIAWDSELYLELTIPRFKTLKIRELKN